MADGSAGRAVVHDRQGTLIALDLETGAVLWRRGRALRPCAIVAGNVVALHVGASPALEVELLDADEGTELWTSPALALPEWAHPTLQDSPEFTVSTAEEQDPLVIRWTARALYRGGAPPGPDVAGSQHREAHGALRVGVATPSVEPLPGTATGAEAETEAEVAPPPHPPLAADVLDHGQVGDLRLELTVRPGSGDEGAVVLRAVDTRTASTVWEAVLDETAERRPRRLRP
ncbi:PQQ-binding-like beta-propeller repeat protein [Streptomyces sp. NPDC004284]|uniref:outer membrane protein assembly factor BamB family protein n=1 Tax=Streptomyces sp. NPDC004284 TaxID=3364695 RepID=UPI003698E5AF